MNRHHMCRNLGSALAALGLVLGGLRSVQAVSITGQQTAVNEWSYDVTFAPQDNYSIFQPTTTITLTGLFGVVGAAGPTSTDWPDPFGDTVNLDWTAAVLNGGTEVQWTHFGGGTGNWDEDRHIYGFRVLASGAIDGLVSLTTSGMSRDTNNPLPDGTYDVDITGFVAGPVVPEPASIALFALGLAGLAICKLRSVTRQASGLFH